MLVKMLLRYVSLTVFLSTTSIVGKGVNAEDLVHRGHISILSGGTLIPHEDATAWTLGVDLEYRVNRPLGLGIVAEHAFGELDATTLLAVADLHFLHGLVLQIGPGIEIANGHSTMVGRVGALYEFEFADRITVSPQLHYDVSQENSVVFGLAAGMSF